MDTFGERLRSEREDRGLSLQAVAETLGVDCDRLQALEQNDFAALPNEAVMVDSLRAYAGCLGVDAELMIEDYVREREQCLRQLAQTLPDRTVETAPAQPGFPRRLAAAMIVTMGALLAAWWMFAGNDAPSAPTQGPADSTQEKRCKPFEINNLWRHPRLENLHFCRILGMINCVDCVDRWATEKRFSGSGGPSSRFGRPPENGRWRPGWVTR